MPLKPINSLSDMPDQAVADLLIARWPETWTSQTTFCFVLHVSGDTRPRGHPESEDHMEIGDFIHAQRLNGVSEPKAREAAKERFNLSAEGIKRVYHLYYQNKLIDEFAEASAQRDMPRAISAVRRMLNRTLEQCRLR